MLNISLSCIRIDAQSKACQKVHWKAGHKAVCPNNVVVNQKHGETPEQKAYWKKIRRYMNTWTHAITYCLPVALDLANYEWGRHETHVYVPLLWDPSSHFLIKPDEKSSLALGTHRSGRRP